MEYIQNMIEIYENSEDEDERTEIVEELNEIYKLTCVFINGE